MKQFRLKHGFPKFQGKWLVNKHRNAIQEKAATTHSVSILHGFMGSNENASYTRKVAGK